MVASALYRQRSDSRRMAFQLLFSAEMNDLPAETLFDEGYYCEEIGLPCDFSRMLFVGAIEHLELLDQLIAETSIDWQLSRMPLADKAILRLAIFEMMYVEDVPISVSIDEAVELAKVYGAEEKSPAFVNGVLGRIAKRLSDDPTGMPGTNEGPGGEAAQAQNSPPAAQAPNSPPTSSQPPGKEPQFKQAPKAYKSEGPVNERQ